MDTFTKEVDTPDGIAVALKTLGSDSQKQHCIFLKGKQCSVYEVRPTQCVTYPFWPQSVSSEADWKLESSRCPGISMYKRAEIDEFNSDTIFKEVILHQVHARGLGMNMSHAEASEVLLETISNEPAMVKRTLDYTINIAHLCLSVCYAPMFFRSMIFVMSSLRVILVVQYLKRMTCP